ncbi:hypothetical protein C8Q75DRAFT_125610 [Abortiporus biennis]|nr:hypothetical protein C8Q75DRAFT_125610 [Abortiporus biennis]
MDPTSKVTMIWDKLILGPPTIKCCLNSLTVLQAWCSSLFSSLTFPSSLALLCHPGGVHSMIFTSTIRALLLLVAVTTLLSLEVFARPMPSGDPGLVRLEKRLHEYSEGGHYYIREDTDLEQSHDGTFHRYHGSQPLRLESRSDSDSGSESHTSTEGSQRSTGSTAATSFEVHPDPPLRHVGRTGNLRDAFQGRGTNHQPANAQPQPQAAAQHPPPEVHLPFPPINNDPVHPQSAVPHNQHENPPVASGSNVMVEDQVNNAQGSATTDGTPGTGRRRGSTISRMAGRIGQRLRSMTGSGSGKGKGKKL